MVEVNDLATKRLKSYKKSFVTFVLSFVLFCG
jgi:hypothetical protein